MFVNTKFSAVEFLFSTALLTFLPHSFMQYNFLKEHRIMSKDLALETSNDNETTLERSVLGIA
jgi:hypothetical protein